MKIPNFSQEQGSWQQLDNRSSLKRLKRSDDNLKLPENFEVGRAIADGNCFFDSFRQGLEQQLGIKVSVQQLREDCKKFAQNDPPQWFKDAVANSYDNNFVRRRETSNSYAGNILDSNRRGDPDIEGRIICEKYDVKLHVIEKHNVGGKEIWTDQIVDDSGSRSIDNIDYNEVDTIHIVNRGHLHFEPVLSTQEIQHGKQRSSDFSDYDDNQITRDEELINVVRSNDSQEGKLEKIRDLLRNGANINFKDANHENNTPLHIAVRKQELKVIELLVENKANIYIKNDRGRTPLDIAERLKKQDIVQILKTPKQKGFSAGGRSDPKLVSHVQESKSSGQHGYQSSRELSRFLSLLSSKELFESEYRKLYSMEEEIIYDEQKKKYYYFDESGEKIYTTDISLQKIKGLYLQALIEIKNAIQVSDINRLKNLSELISYINNIESKVALRTFYGDSNNPIKDTNLIILACEYNKVEVLDYLFNDQTKILDNLSTTIERNELNPHDTDKEERTAFYYAMRSGNVNLLDKLNKWSVKYLGSSVDTNSLLSDAYERLKLDNMPKKMQVWVKNMVNLDSPNGSSTNQDDKEDYAKEGTAGIKGSIYQVKLLMLFLHRGLEKQYSFRLATEMEAAEKFDDLAFEYIENNQKKYRFLQAKHKEDESKKITVDDLLTEGQGDFGLLKYFNSYRKIKQKPEFVNDVLKDFIICTNINFDFLNDEAGEVRSIKGGITVEKIEDQDDVLNVQSKKEAIRYQFKGNFLGKEKVYQVLREASSLTRLARKLAECVLYNKSIQHHLEDSIFKLYHTVLAKEVINTRTKKFHANFLNPSSEELSELTKVFRDIFKEEVKKEIERYLQLTKKEKNKKKIILDPGYKQDVLKQINEKGTVLKLSKGFGESPGEENFPNDKVTDGDIKGFLDHLVFAVNQPNEVELGTIIKNEIGKEFNYIDSKNVYSRFQKKMLNWMKEKEGCFLSHEEGKTFFEKVKKEILGAIWFDIRDPVELFTGRERELNELHKALRRNQDKGKVTVISQMTSISGLGGVGKSELARKYAYDYRQGYDNNVIWINAEKYETMVESFLKLARDNKLGIPTKDKDGKEKSIESIVKEVYGFFVRGERKSLFIFDNAERYKTQKKEDGSEDVGIDRFLPSFLPPEKKPHIMATSHNQELEENIEMLLLDTFTEEEAAEFIRKALNIKDGSQESEVKKLAETLQCFPLALQQAVAYIREENKKLENIGEKFSINDYLEEYKKEETKTKELLDFHLPEKNGYTRTTFITWKITLKKIKQMDYGNEALDIMDIIAYFAPNNISTKIFLERITDKRELGSALQLLKQYSMIGLEQGEANIHRLVQQVTRIELKGQNKERDVLREALNLLKKSMEERGNPTGSIYTSHAVSVWNYASKYEELVKKFSGLPSNIIDELNNSVRYKEAYLFGVKASKLLSDKLGADHYDTLNARDNVAAVLDHQGRYDEALKAYQEVFDKRKRVFGPDHLLTVGTMSNIAVTFDKQGKYDKALAASQEGFNKFNEAFDKFWRMLGSDDPFDRDNPFALGVMNNIAVVLSKQGKYDEALEDYQKVLDERKQTRGPDHPDTLKVRNNIATVLVRQGKYDEALATLQETFDKLKQILGPNHPDTLTTRNNIAGVLYHQGKYDEALGAYQEVFDKFKQILGPDHPDTLNTRNNIARVLDNQGKYDEALEAYQEVFDKFKQILGPDHPDTLKTRNNIARVLDSQGKYEEALEAYQGVFDKRKQMFGPDHPDTLKAKNNIAGVLDNQGKYDEALQAYQEVFDKRKQILGSDHPDTLNTKSNIARVLGSQGKYDEALQAYQEVFDKRKQVLGPDHPDTLNTKSTIARVLWSQGKYDEALQANQEVFDKRKQILGPDHPDTLNTKSTIALALGYQGKEKYDEALTVLRNILDKRKQILGPDHPDTLKTIGNIALTLCNQGKYDEALQAYQEVFDKRR